ncbi:putative membrane protein [Arthrobacter sp. JUb115]|nr:putative membrane protein [Arthrobacter sp. JUb115]
MLVFGTLAMILTGLLGQWIYAPAVGWTVAAFIYTSSVWLTVAPMDAERTAFHAAEEDPGQRTSELLILMAAVSSLAAVALVIMGSSDVEGAGRFALALLAMSCTAMSWLMIHTLFTLRYAKVYFSGEPGGIDFNQTEPPQYTDIAYMAFSVGMTYQVADTNITSGSMRSVVLNHSLLAFVFGTGLLATTINLVISLIG